MWMGELEIGGGGVIHLLCEHLCLYYVTSGCQISMSEKLLSCLDGLHGRQLLDRFIIDEAHCVSQVSNITHCVSHTSNSSPNVSAR